MENEENQLIENIIPILKNLEKEIPINLEVYGNTLKKIEKTASPINNIKKTKKALFSRYLFGTFYSQEIQSLFLSCVEGDLNVNEIMEYSSQKKEKELEHKIAFNKDENLRKELFFDMLRRNTIGYLFNLYAGTSDGFASAVNISVIIGAPFISSIMPPLSS